MANYLNFGVFLMSGAVLQAWQLIVNKTEGIMCGRYKRNQSVYTGPGAAGIKWAKPGEPVISLGIPIFSSAHESAEPFWEAKYRKTKSLLANWTSLDHLSVFGRVMVANSLIMSRFRYWAYCMPLPSWLNEAIHEDVQSLVWSKHCCCVPSKVP